LKTTNSFAAGNFETPISNSFKAADNAGDKISYQIEDFVDFEILEIFKYICIARKLNNN